MGIAREQFDTPGDARPRPHGNCYWLVPGQVLAGDHPARGGAEALPLRLAGLQAAGVTCCIDLTGAQAGPQAYQPLPVNGRAARRETYSIADFGVPTAAGMRLVLNAIEAAIAADDVVYLHCHAGIGRTGTVAGCLLVEHGFTPAEALALLQRKWLAVSQRAWARSTPETQEQRAFIAAWRPG